MVSMVEVMAFTASQAFELLKTAFHSNRLPHALLITGDEEQGVAELILSLLHILNGVEAESLDSVRDEYCRIVRPKSKTRRILREDIRSIEPFLQQMAAENKWKVVVFMDAERMNEEAANAFLKTLEEPPRQSLILLVTNQPEQLLRTILSRCVRINLLQSSEFKLTSIQEVLMPYWIKACNRINNDVTALSFRSQFVAVMEMARKEITRTLTQALKEESKEVAQGTDTADWESQHKETLAAHIETEYLEQRAQALELMTCWFGQAALIASGAPSVSPIHPDVVKLSKQMSVQELLQRMESISRLRDDLNFNISEPLAFDVHFLDALGKK